LRAVAELAVAVPAPGPDAAVALDGEAMVAAAGDRDDVCDVLDPHRRAPRRRGAVSQIAVGVVAPGPDAAVGAQRVGLVRAACDRDDAAEPRHLHRAGA